MPIMNALLLIWSFRTLNLGKLKTRVTALMVIDDVLAVGEHVTEDFVGADKRPEFFHSWRKRGRCHGNNTMRVSYRPWDHIQPRMEVILGRTTVFVGDRRRFQRSRT